MKKTSAVLGALVASANVSAGNMLFDLGVGLSNISISEDTGLSLYELNQNALAASIGMGYLFDNRLVIGFDTSAASNNVLLSALDNTTVRSTSGYIGAQFEQGSFYFRPTLGYAYYNGRFREGAVVNLGQHQERNDSGQAWVGTLTAGIRVSDEFGISGSYRYMDMDLSQANTFLINFNFFVPSAKSAGSSTVDTQFISAPASSSIDSYQGASPPVGY